MDDILDLADETLEIIELGSVSGDTHGTPTGHQFELILNVCINNGSRISPECS